MSTRPSQQPDFNPRTYQRFWQLLDEIKPAQGRLQRAVRKAETTCTDSDENLAAQAKGNAALAEIEQAIREWVAGNGCTCGRIALGMEVTENREWNPECREHGRDSTWWNAPAQRADRATRRAASIELQAGAREARARATSAAQES